MHSRWRVIAAALASSLPLAAAPAWPQAPAGGEFQANTFTIGDQRTTGSAFRKDGGFVIVWTSAAQDGSSAGVFGRRYDATGAALGAEFRVNTYTIDSQSLAPVARPVASTPDGRFVVVWTSYYQDGDYGGIFGQRFDASGARLGAEFQVNSYTTGPQRLPSVAFARDRTFVVTWESYGQDGSYGTVVARRFDAAGNGMGAEFIVNSYTTGDQRQPHLGMDGAGNFIIVWMSILQDGDAGGVFGQRFNASGARAGDEFQVNASTAGGQVPFGLHVFGDGSFVVAWEGQYADGDGQAAVVRRFDAAANPLGPEVVVNTYTTGNQLQPTVAGDQDGSFVVVFGDGAGSPGDGGAGPGGPLGVFAQRFDAAGNRRGSNFLVNTYTTGDQQGGHVASDVPGNFLVTWTSTLLSSARGGGSGQDGSAAGAFAQRYGGLIPAALAVDTSGNRVLEPGEAVDVRPSWRNVNGAAQTFTGTLSNITGPAGPTHTITDGTASYGTVANGATAQCITSDCYAVSVSNPVTRPVLHWDASALESILPDTQGQRKRWVLHVGKSFTDVPASSSFYRFVETLLHHSITGGCGATAYCPASSTTREQMAVFVLVAKEGPGYTPPACGTPVFNDVPASSPFCRFIEELARRGVVSGCGAGSYCPADPVTREQMAVFVLRTLEPTLSTPACTTPMFNDVPASSPFCRWIEELARRGVVAGCGGGNYCPTSPVTREQMGVFIGVTFGLILYGP